MNKYLLLIFSYLLALGLGMVLPFFAVLQGEDAVWVTLSLNTIAFITLVLAGLFLTTLLAKVAFPDFWYRAQVQNQDVFEHEGVYFMGIRDSRQKTRLMRILFGVDDRLRKWDVLFFFIFIGLALPHFLGSFALDDYYKKLVPSRPKFAESLHMELLSNLPVVKKAGISLEINSALGKKVKTALGDLKRQGGQDPAQLYQAAQWNLIGAFQPRSSLNDPFRYGPGDQVFFNRSKGALAVDYLTRILESPRKKDFEDGAHTLIGFFHLSDHNFVEATRFFQKAMDTKQGESSGIQRYLITILTANAKMLSGDPKHAGVLLESILVDEHMPRSAYPIATEHYADALRLEGKTDRVMEVLNKALGLYRKQGNTKGLARVHLRISALAQEQGSMGDASRSLSLASSLAQGQRDGFTLNMVGWMSQFF